MWSTGSEVTGRVGENDTSSKTLPDELEGLNSSGLGTLTSSEIATQVIQVIFFHYMHRLAKVSLKRLEQSCLAQLIELNAQGKQLLADGYHTDYPTVVMTKTTAPNTIQTSILQIQDWKSLCEAATQFELAAQICDRACNWAKQHYVDRQWFLDLVVLNLGDWVFSDRSRRRHSWWHGTVLQAKKNYKYTEVASFKISSSIEKLVPPPQITPYNPVAQTREEHKKGAMQNLERYYTAQEQFYQAKGFVSTVRKRARVESPWLHVEWFVKYQILGWTAARIAEKYTLTAVHEGSIYQTVKKIAQQLDFELRPRLGTRDRKKSLA